MASNALTPAAMVIASPIVAGEAAVTAEAITAVTDTIVPITAADMDIRHTAGMAIRIPITAVQVILCHTTAVTGMAAAANNLLERCEAHADHET